MTFDELADEFLTRELSVADSTDLFTSTRRQFALIEGQLEFARLTDCLIRQSTITCSNGVAEYNLLSTTFIAGGDFVKLAAQGPEYRLVSSNSTASGSTRYVAGKDFRKTDVQRLNDDQPGWRDSTGADMPESWYLRRDGGRHYVGLYPPPTIGSSETGSLTLPYVARPATTDVSTNEPLTISSQTRTDLRPYHPAVGHYAAAQLTKFRKDKAESDRQMQLFLGYVTAYIQDQRPAQGTRIMQTRTYFREASRIRERVTDPRR